MAASKATILVVDDDPDIRRILQDRLEALGHRVLSAGGGDEALQVIAAQAPDLMLLDLQLPGIDGMQVLHRLRDGTEPAVIVITAFGTIEKAVKAMQKGAVDFITKPFSPEHLDLVIKRALERRALAQEHHYLRKEVNAPYLDIVGDSAKLKEATQVARKVAAASTTVLLLGESGSGKEVFARAIHRWSPRARAPFVVVNCVALRDELLESELFGHEKGAFTSAHERKRGKLEIADGGTVFLDEIGDFKPDLQAKLLRVIQEREFERVGGTKRIEVDIRIVAATNRDLHQDVREGRFREDLFFRLNVVTISLPALREKSEDIPLLADMFLRRHCRMLNKPMMTISARAMEHLLQYHWPGNVRELGNLMERAVVLAKGPVITPEDLPLLGPPVAFEEPDGGRRYHDAVRRYQRQVIRRALTDSGGNQARAAQTLGLQRTYLARLIKKLEIRQAEDQEREAGPKVT